MKEIDDGRSVGVLDSDCLFWLLLFCFGLVESWVDLWLVFASLVMAMLDCVWLCGGNTVHFGFLFFFSLEGTAFSR